ncbi:unnamed protein product [Leptidea sinapis]|uniref:Uncharacterized protein n=1 Tax=Leptidea sinapis TaxID=189913 RepID=A0A5E4QSY2_9NEOP|nr:unnamed protein product [Leptidea sinapis]
MNRLFLYFFIYCLYYNIYVSPLSIINRYSECGLEETLIEEIKSYKNMTSTIMKGILNTFIGIDMYDEYDKFIDKFGARPSGSKVLEDSIDYMVNLTIAYDTRICPPIIIALAYPPLDELNHKFIKKPGKVNGLINGELGMFTHLQV